MYGDFYLDSAKNNLQFEHPTVVAPFLKTNMMKFVKLT